LFAEFPLKDEKGLDSERSFDVNHTFRGEETSTRSLEEVFPSSLRENVIKPKKPTYARAKATTDRGASYLTRLREAERVQALLAQRAMPPTDLKVVEEEIQGVRMPYYPPAAPAPYHPGLVHPAYGYGYGHPGFGYGYPGFGYGFTAGQEFARLDQNGDGKITEAEMKQALGRHNMPFVMDRGKTVPFMKAIDKDGDGVISRQEFANAVGGYSYGPY